MTKNKMGFPGFGESASFGKDYLDLDFKAIAKRIAASSFLGLLSGLIGFWIGAILGAAIGAMLGICIGAFLFFLEQRKILSSENQYNPLLPNGGISHERAPVKLGEKSLCDVIVSNNVIEIFEYKKMLIRGAETSIEFSPNFAGGKEFQEILELMEFRMEERLNLKVHIIMSEDLLTDEDISKIEFLEKKFEGRFKGLITQRIFFTRPFFHTQENHVKMLIVDGRYFAIGGAGIHKKMATEDSNTNNVPSSTFADQFIDKAFRDTDLIGQGIVAQTMRAQFFALFRKWERKMTDQDNDRFFALDALTISSPNLLREDKKLRKNIKIKFFVGGPEHREHNPIVKEYVKCIQAARYSIKIANLLFNPPSVIKEALEKKKQEGVAREGFFNGTDKDNSLYHYLYALPNRNNYHLLSKVFEYKKSNTLFHKKVATFDSSKAIIGSFNLGIKSSFCDDEAVCVIEDAKAVQDIEHSFDEDRLQSEDYSRASLALKQAVAFVPSLLVTPALAPYFG